MKTNYKLIGALLITLLFTFTTGCTNLQKMVDEGKQAITLIGEENVKIKVKQDKLKDLETDLEKDLKTELAKWWWKRDYKKIIKIAKDIKKYTVDIISESDNNSINIIKLRTILEKIDKNIPWYSGMLNNYEATITVTGLGSAKIKKGYERETLKSLVGDIEEARHVVGENLNIVKSSMEEIKTIAVTLENQAEELSSLVAARRGNNPVLDAQAATVLVDISTAIDALEGPTFAAFSNTVGHDFAHLVSLSEEFSALLSSFIVTPDEEGRFSIEGYVTLPPLGDIKAGDLISVNFPSGFELAEPVDVETSNGLLVTVLGNSSCSDGLTFIVDAVDSGGNNEIAIGLRGFNIKNASTLRFARYYSSVDGVVTEFPIHVIGENAAGDNRSCTVNTELSTFSLYSGADTAVIKPLSSAATIFVTQPKAFVWP